MRQDHEQQNDNSESSNSANNSSEDHQDEVQNKSQGHNKRSQTQNDESADNQSRAQSHNSSNQQGDPQNEKMKVLEEESATADEKVIIEFPYSELVRAKIPKAFDVVEKVATDWKNEGEFQDLGLPHPLADVVAAEALKKAKQVEKKLEEKGVFNIAKMGIAIAKAQAEELQKKVFKK